MKTKKSFLMTSFLFLIMGMGGCEEKDYLHDYYEGKIINLNGGDGCSNIMEIVKSIDIGTCTGILVCRD